MCVLAWMDLNWAFEIIDRWLSNSKQFL
jgi:hypothetical protein